MASAPTRRPTAQAGRPAAAPPRRRRPVPVSGVVIAYVVAATAWVLGGASVIDLVADATAMARWTVRLGLGVLFVALTALVLGLSMRRQARRLDAADARTLDADVRTHDRARQLAASEDRNRLQSAAMSGTTTAVVVTDRDGTIEWVNAAFELLSGYPTSVAVGATPRLLQSGVHAEPFFRELWETILAGRVWHGEVVNRRGDGQLYSVNQTITPVVGGRGRVQHFVATLEQVTERDRPARGPATSGRAGRAGPEPDATTRPVVGMLEVHGEAPVDEVAAEAERITTEALCELLQAQTADQVRGIVLSVVHRLGGWTVPARLGHSDALPVDLSFGVDEPLLPAAEPSGPARASLERHLPRLVEDARRALENLTRTEQLAHDASVDPLTGLLNRRAYERILPRLEPGDAVVVFDLDGFKPVNDTHGHEAGDQVLRSFGATLRSVTRATDHPCRIGGDEFALLLAGPSAANAESLIDRLRSGWEQQRPWPVDFSVGIAVVADDPAATAAAADRAMYNAKRSGQGDPAPAAVSSREGPS